MPVINLKEAVRLKDANESLIKLNVDFDFDQPDLISCCWNHVSFSWDGEKDGRYITAILTDMPVLIPIPNELEPNSDNVKLLIACFLNRLY